VLQEFLEPAAGGLWLSAVERIRMRPSAAEGESAGGAVQHTGNLATQRSGSPAESGGKCCPAAGGLWWPPAERNRIGLRGWAKE